MPKAERPKNRKIRLVGGGFRWTRQPSGIKGGSMRSQRRLERKINKKKKKRS